MCPLLHICISLRLYLKAAGCGNCNLSIYSYSYSILQESMPFQPQSFCFCPHCRTLNSFFFIMSVLYSPNFCTVRQSELTENPPMVRYFHPLKQKYNHSLFSSWIILDNYISGWIEVGDVTCTKEGKLEDFFFCHFVRFLITLIILSSIVSFSSVGVYFHHFIMNQSSSYLETDRMCLYFS